MFLYCQGLAGETETKPTAGGRVHGTLHAIVLDIYSMPSMSHMD